MYAIPPAMIKMPGIVKCVAVSFYRNMFITNFVTTLFKHINLLCQLKAKKKP